MIAFLVLTFALTWLCWIAAAALARQSPAAAVSLAIQALVLLGTIAPSLVALVLTARREGRPAVREIVAYWSALIPRQEIRTRVEVVS